MLFKKQTKSFTCIQCVYIVLKPELFVKKTIKRDCSNLGQIVANCKKRPVTRIISGGGCKVARRWGNGMLGLFIRWYMVFFITLAMYVIKANLFNKCS